MKILSTVICLFILTGCAGMHAIPDANYALKGKNQSLRVAFDQDGNIYPRDTNKFDWSAPNFNYLEPIFGSSYQLEKWFQPKYPPEEQNTVYTSVLSELNQSLNNGDTLVVMIHGFNNRYSDALNVYDLMRSNINKDVFVLEVFWDGLHERNPSKVNVTKLHFWNKALLYSNYAGNKGLRTILSGINKDIHLRFVTHSRGAAVAFSSIADPLYDSEFNITRPPLKNGHIRDIKMALFAPAIGNGHITSDLEERVHFSDIKVYLGTNKKDIATSKFAFSSVKGDTSLGGNLEYLNNELYIIRENISFQRGEFRHGYGHALADYFSDEKLTSCFFWAVDLNTKKPKGCFLYR